MDNVPPKLTKETLQTIVEENDVVDSEYIDTKISDGEKSIEDDEEN